MYPMNEMLLKPNDGDHDNVSVEWANMWNKTEQMCELNAGNIPNIHKF